MMTENTVVDIGAGIPDVILRFFENKGGHSLIIRGGAGTGKTTLSLEILKHFGGKEHGKYISSRTSDETLKLQFPWIFEDGTDEPRPFTREKLNKLEGLVQDGLLDEDTIEDRFPPQYDGGSILMPIGEDLPEMEEAYRFVEEKHPEKVLIVIDSINGLSEHYAISKEKLMHTIQYDLVEKNRVNVIFIVEQRESSTLDYLVDGVIDLSLDIQEGRVFRSMSIEKMRGVAIRKPERTFTLTGGRYYSPAHVNEEALFDLEKYPTEVQEDIGVHGHGVLDNMLLDFFSQGDFSQGGVHLIKSKHSSDRLASLLEGKIVSYSLEKGWGVAWVPSRKATSNPEKRLPPSLLPKLDGGRFRIFEVPLANPSMFTAPLVGADIYKEMGPSKLSEYLKKTRGPYVYVLDIAQLTTVIARGEGRVARNQLSFLLSVLNATGNTVFCFVEENSPFINIISELSRTSTYIDRLNGNFVIYGEKPFTPAYAAYMAPNKDSMHLVKIE